MKSFLKILSSAVPASFTIEASVILPIAFVITAWFITTSFTIHDRIQTFSEAVFTVIKNASAEVDPSEEDNPYSGRINIANLDGRKVLLKYKLLADGLKTLTGGLDDED